jgi:hypothetical protein
MKKEEIKKRIIGETHSHLADADKLSALLEEMDKRMVTIESFLMVHHSSVGEIEHRSKEEITEPKETKEQVSIHSEKDVNKPQQEPKEEFPRETDYGYADIPKSIREKYCQHQEPDMTSYRFFESLLTAFKRGDIGYSTFIEKSQQFIDKEIQKYKDALIWCSGSEDFQIEGKARKGWEKICVPLLK